MQKNKFVKLVAFVIFSVFFYNGSCNKDAEDIVVVPTGDEFITWQIPGHSGSLSLPLDVINIFTPPSGITIFSGSNTGSTKKFYASFVSNQNPGVFATTYCNIYVDGKYYVQTSTPIQLNITTYGTAGGNIIGTYSGTLKDSTSSSMYSVSGQFKLIN